MNANPKSGGKTKEPNDEVTVDQLGVTHHKHHMLPVWFFIGVLLFIYGVLILIEGLVEYSHPPDTVLSNLHPAVWWGGLLLAIGAFYTWKFRPGQS